MFRELLTGLAVVFMASSVIISNIFRSTRSDRPQLPAKNVSNNASITDEQNVSASKLESTGSDSKPTELSRN